MRIAVFLPNWVGDAVMATPAVRALRQHFPDARLVGVLKPYVAGVLDGSPWFDELIFLDKCGGPRRGTLAVARQLLAEDVDLAVLFPNSFRSGPGRLAGPVPPADRLRPLRPRLAADRRPRTGPRRPRQARCPARSSTPTTGSPSRPAADARPAWSCRRRRGTRRRPTHVWRADRAGPTAARSSA